MIKQPNQTTINLYIIATPIGNLGDMTFRAVETIKLVDTLLCEDTRISKKLLSHFGISKKVETYNDFSEDRITQLITRMQAGEVFGLISDAGTPGICDPGFKLIDAVYTHDLVVEVLPGACAFVPALVGANLKRDCFQFLGFLKTKRSSLFTQLDLINTYPGISIIYEAPHRLIKTVMLLEEHLDQPYFCLARELTKLHEEWVWGDAQTIINYYQTHPLKGEIVLLITTHPQDEKLSDEQIIFLVNREIELGELKNQAIKKVSKKYQLDKKYVYNLMIGAKND